MAEVVLGEVGSAVGLLEPEYAVAAVGLRERDGPRVVAEATASVGDGRGEDVDETAGNQTFEVEMPQYLRVEIQFREVQDIAVEDHREFVGGARADDAHHPENRVAVASVEGAVVVDGALVEGGKEDFAVGGIAFLSARDFHGVEGNVGAVPSGLECLVGVVFLPQEIAEVLPHAVGVVGRRGKLVGENPLRSGERTGHVADDARGVPGVLHVFDQLAGALGGFGEPAFAGG